MVDLTGDGRADRLVIRARGTNSDSLAIALEVGVSGKVLTLATWSSSYELIDPPFEGDTVRRAEVDSFIRSRLTDVLKGVQVSIAPISEDYMEMNPESCDGDLKDCLHRQWGFSSVDGRDPAVELTAGPVPIVSFGYGYETSIAIAWAKSFKRFFGIAECC